jgi:hypothetical protein
MVTRSRTAAEEAQDANTMSDDTENSSDESEDSTDFVNSPPRGSQAPASSSCRRTEDRDATSAKEIEEASSIRGSLLSKDGPHEDARGQAEPQPTQNDRVPDDPNAVLRTKKKRIKRIGSMLRHAVDDSPKQHKTAASVVALRTFPGLRDCHASAQTDEERDRFVWQAQLRLLSQAVAGIESNL